MLYDNCYHSRQQHGNCHPVYLGSSKLSKVGLRDSFYLFYNTLNLLIKMVPLSLELHLEIIFSSKIHFQADKIVLAMSPVLCDFSEKELS